MRRLLFLLFLCAAGYYFFWREPPAKTQPPGMLVSSEPEQQSADVASWTKGNYTIRPLATFFIQARVLGKAHYVMGREADLSEYDLALGWHAMSDTNVISQLHISQSNRWYHYRWDNAPPIPPEQIISSSANMHMIAGSREVERMLASVAEGNVVALSGYLVEVSAPDGWRWVSSLSRGDSGDHSCEVVWVSELKILR